MCCLGCAIFGITEVPTDGVDFDTGDISGSATSDTAGASATGGTATAYVPPPANAQSAAPQPSTTPDMEQGSATAPAGGEPTADPTIPKPSQPSQPPTADLLDVEQGQPPPAENRDSAMQNSLHELD